MSAALSKFDPIKAVMLPEGFAWRVCARGGELSVKRVEIDTPEPEPTPKPEPPKPPRRVIKIPPMRPAKAKPRIVRRPRGISLKTARPVIATPFYGGNPMLFPAVAVAERAFRMPRKKLANVLRRSIRSPLCCGYRWHYAENGGKT